MYKTQIDHIKFLSGNYHDMTKREICNTCNYMDANNDENLRSALILAKQYEVYDYYIMEDQYIPERILEIYLSLEKGHNLLETSIMNDDFYFLKDEKSIYNETEVLYYCFKYNALKVKKFLFINIVNLNSQLYNCFMFAFEQNDIDVLKSMMKGNERKYYYDIINDQNIDINRFLYLFKFIEENIERDSFLLLHKTLFEEKDISLLLNSYNYSIQDIKQLLKRMVKNNYYFSVIDIVTVKYRVNFLC